MGSVRSLGLHQPSAIPYLVAESILPPDPKPCHYSWQIYADGHVEEEVLFTKTCVAWTRGKLIRKLFTFDIECQDVRHATLTWFEGPSQTTAAQGKEKDILDHVQSSESRSRDVSGRALVVFLTSQAQVFFLSGARHIINLPFEVGNVFPTPRGLIVQRKLGNKTKKLTSFNSPPTPTAPHNSFLSGPSQTSQNRFVSFLDAPFPSVKAPDVLDFDLLTAPHSCVDEDLPRHYSITSPLSEFGLVVNCPSETTGRGRLSVPGTEPSMDALDSNEEILYVSPVDEVPRGENCGPIPLILLVTANRARQVYTLWHALYPEPRRMCKLSSEQRASNVASHQRKRRSSFLTTGASTPAMRTKDGVRESLGGIGRTRASAVGAGKKRESDVKATEDALESRLDSEFETRQPAKESRRVSSLLSRADLNASFDRSAFHGLATQHSVAPTSFSASGRRGNSLGVSQTSVGSGFQAISESSEPLSPALTPRPTSEDTGVSFLNVNPSTQEVDTHSDDDFDGQEFGQVQVTHEGLEKECVLLKFGEVSMKSRNRFAPKSSPKAPTSNPKVLTCFSPCTSEERGLGGRRYFVIIVDPEMEEIFLVELLVRSQNLRDVNPLTNASATEKRRATGLLVAVPSLRDFTRHHSIVDVIKVVDGNTSRVLCIRREKRSRQSLSIYSPWALTDPLSLSVPKLRAYNPFDIYLPPRSVGIKRTITAPERLVRLESPGPDGSFNVVGVDGVAHRLQIRLTPRNELVSKLIDMCYFSLPLPVGEKIFSLWMSQISASQSSLQDEWFGIISSILAVALAYTHPKSREMKTHDAVANFTLDSEFSMRRVDLAWNDSNSWTTSAWNWVLASGTPKMSPRAPRKSDIAVKSMNRQKRDSSGTFKNALNLVLSLEGKSLAQCVQRHKDALQIAFPKFLYSLHTLREEMKLGSLHRVAISADMPDLAPLIAQLSRWFNWCRWGWKNGDYYGAEMANLYGLPLDDVSGKVRADLDSTFSEPPAVYKWIEKSLIHGQNQTFPSMDNVYKSISYGSPGRVSRFCQRIVALKKLASVWTSDLATERQVEKMISSGITSRMLDSFPEGLLPLFQEPVIRCQAQPPTTWPSHLLHFVSREDLDFQSNDTMRGLKDASAQRVQHSETRRDLHTICQHTENTELPISLPSSERISVSRLIFHEDRRFAEAVRMVEPYRVAHAEYIPDPHLSETQVLDAEKEVVQWAMVRTFALSPGLALANFESRNPLLTEKFTVHGYNTLCKIKPANHTVSADRTSFTEERFGWAWFHAGVAAGLSISRNAQGIDTSWVIFNRPTELNNRHAGLLLALGLNGHLKTLAKWLGYKYLKQKHTMTRVGLLLGLSASHIGTMDTLVTRLLSVHVTRMLPPGAAELNLSPLEQTAGLMGIGLLYCNTQHRRMSEVMLSEIEHIESEVGVGTVDSVRDESYRLSAGIALGFINLGKGGDLKGLQDLRLLERLLSVAVGSKPIGLVHDLDQATAGATIAIALIYMKTGNKAVAQKIDVPDTQPQFDFIRPDILLLRTVAKHLILWNDIQASSDWINSSLPADYRAHCFLHDIRRLRSEHTSFYHILAGLLWAIGLKHAGSRNTSVRDFLITYLDQFMRLCALPATRYDAKLARNAARNCQDLVALSAATVMSGTGDLDLFRRLRVLHNRVNSYTSYGSHMAAHMALGALFLGGGCFAFGHTDLALASLLCAFYPLFPLDVTDNQAHLQALRHFWVLAAEPRCLVPRDIDSHRAVQLPIRIIMRDGAVSWATAPCLLPDLTTVSRVEATISPDHWPVTLDFANNPVHLSFFRREQTLPVRRRRTQARSSTYSSVLARLSSGRAHTTGGSMLRTPPNISSSGGGVGNTPSSAASSAADAGSHAWLFSLAPFRALRDSGDLLAATMLGPEERIRAMLYLRGAPVDDMLMLAQAAARSAERDRLWGVRLVLAWVEEMDARGREVRWVRREGVERLRVVLEGRARGGGRE